MLTVVCVALKRPETWVVQFSAVPVRQTTRCAKTVSDMGDFCKPHWDNTAAPGLVGCLISLFVVQSVNDRKRVNHSLMFPYVGLSQIIPSFTVFVFSEKK